ncbi:MAG: HEPN domain-containing protein [candidate division KSB1 bacterium]|nr:HEPN domain-containing protein [candidate division KSB1 bacterium]MDZ7314461.1 HEPN domain-containing protein [candidate division KSB1 bacterium]
MNRYAFETRYPGHFEPVTEEDYRHALQIAERVVAWAEAIISEKSTPK